MEVEAKLAVPDAGTLERLAALARLGDYDLGLVRRLEMRDVYLDTADRRLTAAGLTCRLRSGDRGYKVTIKELARAGDGVYRREELEVELAEPAAPADWPAAPARARVLAIVGADELAPLVELRQSRRVRDVKRGDALVAELSLDEVQVVSAGGEYAYLELEVELRPDGGEVDLATIRSQLTEAWGLTPVGEAKFTRALALVDGAARSASDGSESPGTSGRSGLGETGPRSRRRTRRVKLTPDERSAAERVASGAGVKARRARALLALDDGATQAAAAAAAGLSERRVRYWLHEFRRTGMDVFGGATASRASVGATAAPAAGPAPAARVPRPGRPGLSADLTMGEAGRRTLAFHFGRMTEHEPGTRVGEDPEELHHMRVATRRMRAALRVFDDHLDADVMRPLLKGLRRTGRTLGAVRDLDVFLEKTQRYLDTLPGERKGELDPLLTVLHEQRDESRERLIAYLDGPRYARFTERFSEFLETPGAGVLPAVSEAGDPRPQLVSRALPVVLYERAAAVWAFDEYLAESGPLVRYHRLRIAGKGLRYTLEFFQEVLGPQARPLINAVKGLQDHLGDLQDAVVSSNALRDFLTWGTWGRGPHAAMPTEVVVAPGVATYLAYRQAELQELVRTFPKPWEAVRGADFSRRLAALVGALSPSGPS